MKGIKNFMQGVVATLSANQATLESGEVIPFDYCAICAGGNQPGAWAKADSHDVTTLAGRIAQMHVRT